MRIPSFGHTTAYRFKQAKQPDENVATSNADKNISAIDDDLNASIKSGKVYSQSDPDFMIEKAINDSYKYLHNGLTKIFTGSESSLAGKSSLEYDEHIKKLSEAIQDQDYKKAEKLIDRFFGGSTDKIISRVKTLATEAENKFWHGIDDSLKYLEANKNEYDLEFDGQQYKNITLKDIAKLAIDKAKNEIDSFSDQDFSGLIGSIRKQAVANAKDSLKNAGQNRYSEDAVSVTASAADFSRNRIFNTDDINIKEDEQELSDIYALKDGEQINQEQIERLKRRNKLKTDTFTGYMRDRSDRFTELFGELSNKAVLVKEAEPETPAEQNIETETISTNLLAESQQAQSMVSVKDFEELQDLVPEQQKSNAEAVAAYGSEIMSGSLDSIV